MRFPKCSSLCVSAQFLNDKKHLTIALHIKHAHGPPERVHAPPREAMFLEALTGLRAPVAALDSLLTGHPPPDLDCGAGWEVVVGDLSCPGYTKVFESGGIPVLRLASPRVHEGR